MPGWCTVQVSTFSGAAVGADFTPAFGRYSLDNANCANPTASATAAAAGAAKAGDAAGGQRAAGGPESAGRWPVGR